MKEMELYEKYKELYDKYNDIKNKKELIYQKIDEELEELRKEVTKKYNRKLLNIEKDEEKIIKELQSYEEDLLKLHKNVNEKTLLFTYEDKTKLYVNVNKKFKVSVPKLREAIVKYPTLVNYCSINSVLLKSVIPEIETNTEDSKFKYLKEIGELEVTKKIQIDNK
jgi:hypothetical protein